MAVSNLKNKTKRQLIDEVEALRLHIAELEAARRADGPFHAQPSQAENALREREGWLRAVLNSAPVIVFATDRQGVFTFNEGKALSQIGVQPGHNVGQSAFTLFNSLTLLEPSGRIATVGDVLRRVLDGETVSGIGTFNGVVFDARYTPLVGARGQVEGLVGVAVDITDGYTAQRAVRESEERFRLIIENMPILLDAFDENGNIIIWNKACEQVTGYRAEEIVGNPRAMEMLYPDPEYRARVWRASQDVGAGETTFDLVCKNGEVRTITWFDTYHTLRIPGWVSWGMGQDITERRRIEEAEREQRTLAEALVDTAAAVNSPLELDKVLDSVLDNVGRAVKHDAADILLVEGAKARVVRSHGHLPQDDPVGLIYPFERFPLIKRLVESNQPLVIADTHQEPDWPNAPETGWVRSLVGVPIRLEGQVIGIIRLLWRKANGCSQADGRRLLAFADQAAVALNNARLYEAERRQRILAQTFQKMSEALSSYPYPAHMLSTVLESLQGLIPYRHAMIMLIEENAMRVEVTRGFADAIRIEHQLYTYAECPRLLEILSRGEPVFLSQKESQPDWGRLPGVDADTSAWAALPLTTWDVTTGLLCLTMTDPNLQREQIIEPLVAFSHSARLAFENSRLLVELLNSRGDLREAQTHLVRSTELAIAGEIATGVAHQISNPLTSVMAHAYLLLQKISPDDPLYEYCKAIKDATDRAANVVQRMLDFARAREFELHPLDVNAALQSAVSLVRAQIEPDSRIILKLGSNLPQVLASQEHLEDVWINLLLNSRDALKGRNDGVITVTSSLDPSDRTITTMIMDNGPGIPAEAQGRIFNSFFTTKEEGVGLGLAICYHIVSQHHGSIQVQSQEGQGARFVVKLPAVNFLAPENSSKG